MDVTDEAEALARSIADRLGLRVVELHSIDGCIAAGELVRRVWDAASADSVVNASTMRALAHSGNYVAGAYAGELLVGVAVAFRGDGHLHSHVVGVLPGHQGGGVGYALKQHQRGWSLRHGIDRVAWTFDPLIRRNAVFNLRKLGAEATEYLPDFYGPLDDGVNTGDVTDRLYIEWRLDSPAAIAAARGKPADADLTGAAVLLACADDRPVANAAAPDIAPLLIATPRDIESLRTRDPDLAAAWRVALREAVLSSLARGYAISGITRTGSYLLRHPEYQEPNHQETVR